MRSLGYGILLASPFVATVAMARESTRWVPIAHASAAEAAVMEPIDKLVKGISTHDVKLLEEAELPEGGGIIIVNENADGSRQVIHQSWEQANARVKTLPPNYEDRVTDALISLDGDMAFVHAKYTVFIDGKANKCGIEHYEVIRKDNVWKVAANTWSQHTTGCEQKK